MTDPKYLRDLNLRLPDDSPAVPDWFWKRSFVEYLFIVELTKLKIRTPGIAKVNIYSVGPEKRARPYRGNVHFGVTDVEIRNDWEGVEDLSPEALTNRCLAVMVRGIKKVLNFFELSTAEIDGAARRARALVFCFSLPLGKKATRLNASHSARLYVRPMPDLTACLVALVIKRGRQVVGERSVCATYPLTWLTFVTFVSLKRRKRAVIAKFWTTSRRDFDHRGLEKVKRIDSGKRVPPIDRFEPTFLIDLSEFLDAA
jgi:hypothetical protein